MKKATKKKIISALMTAVLAITLTFSAMPEAEKESKAAERPKVVTTKEKPAPKKEQPAAPTPEPAPASIPAGTYVADANYASTPQLGASVEDTRASEIILEERAAADNSAADEAERLQQEIEKNPAPAPVISEEEEKRAEEVNRPDEVVIADDGSSNVIKPGEYVPPTSEAGIGENPNNLPTGTGGEVIIEVPEDQPQELPPLDAPEYVTPPELVEDGYVVASTEQPQPEVVVEVVENEQPQPEVVVEVVETEQPQPEVVTQTVDTNQTQPEVTVDYEG